MVRPGWPRSPRCGAPPPQKPVAGRWSSTAILPRREAPSTRSYGPPLRRLGSSYHGRHHHRMVDDRRMAPHRPGLQPESKAPTTCSKSCAEARLHQPHQLGARRSRGIMTPPGASTPACAGRLSRGSSGASAQWFEPVMPGIGTRFGTRGLSIGGHRGRSTTTTEFPAPTPTSRPPESAHTMTAKGSQRQAVETLPHCSICKASTVHGDSQSNNTNLCLEYLTR